MTDNTPTVFGEFLLCYHGQIFQDSVTGKKERLTIVDISYICDGRKKGVLWLKTLSKITDEDCKKIGFSNSFDFFGRISNETNLIYRYADKIRKLGYSTEFRGIPIETQIDRGWIALYSH